MHRLANGFVCVYKYVTDMSNLTYLFTDFTYFFRKNKDRFYRVALYTELIISIYICQALERLEGWAAFAIFPADELNADKYIQFVEQRFQCVAVQLDGFTRALANNKEVL